MFSNLFLPKIVLFMR